MKVFHMAVKSGGIIILLFLSLGFGITYLQTRQAEGLCSSYKVGDKMPSIEQLDSEYLLRPMGPFEVQGGAGQNAVIFCAAATMCDTSCEITFKDSQITKLEYKEY